MLSVSGENSTQHWDTIKDNSRILSFNYTDPFNNRAEGRRDLKEEILVRNIHGYLFKNGEIVIGIDSSDLNSDSAFYKFTKTFRIMSFTQYDAPLAVKTLSKSIKKIIFYGHSFSKSDYSYFQSIFDFYDIYNSNIRLIFEYSSYRNMDLNQEYMKTSKLLNQYGNTFHNEKGKNLMHKLLLEDRIWFIEIPE